MRSLASFTIALLVACSSPKKPPTNEPPPGGSGSGSSAAACPPAKASTEMCAAVITYAKAPDGTCCQYPSPCTVPIAGQQFSDDKCATPMGPAK